MQEHRATQNIQLATFAYWIQLFKIDCVVPVQYLGCGVFGRVLDKQRKKRE